MIFLRGLYFLPFLLFPENPYFSGRVSNSALKCVFVFHCSLNNAPQSQHLKLSLIISASVGWSLGSVWMRRVLGPVRPGPHHGVSGLGSYLDARGRITHCSLRSAWIQDRSHRSHCWSCPASKGHLHSLADGFQAGVLTPSYASSPLPSSSAALR